MQNDYAIPKKYTRSSKLQGWFIAGFTSGFRNASPVHEDDFRRIQGDPVWAAYTDGYQAGENLRGKPEEN